MLYQYEKCVCERCEEPVYVPQWNMPESSHGIVSLCDMDIKSDFVSKSSKTSFDLVFFHPDTSYVPPRYSDEDYHYSDGTYEDEEPPSEDGDTV